MAHFFGLVVLIAIIAVVAYSFGSALFERVEFSPLGFSERLASSTIYRSQIQAVPGGGYDVDSRSPDVPARPAIDPRDIPAGFTAKDVSPYFGKIRFGTVAPGQFGYLSLQSDLEDAETVNVTGWLIRGNEGSHYIPQAVSVYDPSGLASESDIFMKRGDIVNMYFAASAIGRNFRINKCMGYLENTVRFEPPLSTRCPYVSRDEVSHLTGECQNYVLSLGGCRLPSANPPISIYDYTCRSYLDNLNYRGCFERYGKDADFYEREWRVWLGPSRFLDSLHDRVFLFDRQSLLVDERSY